MPLKCDFLKNSSLNPKILSATVLTVPNPVSTHIDQSRYIRSKAEEDVSQLISRRFCDVIQECRWHWHLVGHRTVVHQEIDDIHCNWLHAIRDSSESHREEIKRRQKLVTLIGFHDDVSVANVNLERSTRRLNFNF